jgi:Protein of unknown function (DUF3159)
MTAGQPDGEEAAVTATRPAQRGAASGALSSTMLADAIGGPRGMLDTGIPAVIFVIVNAASSLTPAIFAALGFGVLLVIFRLARKQPIQQALAGFIGIGIAAFFASRTHSAEGFFLPGILSQAALAIGAVVSLIIRKPYIGYVMAALDPRYAHWRSSPRLVRAMNRATMIWAFVFLVRAVVQGLLYLAHRPGWLAAVQLAQGWPFFAAALASTYALARRAAAGEVAAATGGTASTGHAAEAAEVSAEEPEASELFSP